MKDWDYSKNLQIDPSTISLRSSKRVSWKCHECGYEWEGSVKDATEKSINCPKCSRIKRGEEHQKLALKKKGCLTDKELLKDWDYSKNTFLPSEVTSGSAKYVWWKCHKCGYEWRAKISNRTHGRGCACCASKVVVPGINDFETLMPELAKEWHQTKNGDLKPSQVLPGISKKIWWVCPKGHEYQATLNHRTSGQGTNCPKCNSGRQTSFREQALYFYIKKMYPKAISRYKPENFGNFELDIYIPDFNLAIEYDGVAWHKEKNFEREMRKYQLCKKLRIRLIRVKEKMPGELNVQIADDIISSDDFESEDGFTKVIHIVLSHISFDRFYWIKPMDVDLSRDRFEIMKYVSEVKHSFADKCPEIAKEWHPTKNEFLKPTMVKPRSIFKAWWICPECGFEYEQSLGHRFEGCGCPKCAKKRQGQTLKKNLLKKRGGISNPLLIREWDYEKNESLKPEQFTNHSKTKVWWKCSKCGHSWKATITNRSIGRGCPKCAGYKLFIGENDFATMHPELLCEWDYNKNVGIDPHKIHHGSTVSVWWKCSKCGYEYRASVGRRSKGSGCRKCSDKNNVALARKTLLSKRGSLGELHPELIKEWSSENSYSIFDITPGSGKKAKWVCSVCRNKWEASPHVRSRGTGCPICGKIKSAESRKRKKR